MNARATVANLAWLAASAPAYARFVRALRDPAATQSAWLRAHLARNAQTTFGRTLGAPEIRTYADFARRIPISEYDALQPWIERIQRGETRVLTAEPVTRLLPTSGSTATRKLIPFTATLQREFNAAIGPWFVDLCRTTPALLLGPAYWSVTPLTDPETTTTSAIPIGFEDDARYLGGMRAWLIESAMAVPARVRHISNVTAFRRAVLLHLLRCADLRFISVWHPSFLALLLDTLQHDWSTLLTELTIIASQTRIRSLRAADPARLETIWPHLRIVSCWADAHADGPAADLQRRLPNCLVQPKGLLATEAFVTLPFRGRHPVALRSHFFEFIDDQGAIHPLEDLRAGHSYEIVVTTGGGLWRYRLGDRVTVTGHLEGTPTLQFLGRAGNISDRCGEKLSETFVGDVLRALCPGATFAMLAPEIENRTWRYTLFLEQHSALLCTTEQLDRVLSANPHYALCRRLGQLAPPQVARVSHNAFEHFTAAEMERGRRLGDIKPTPLSQRTDWATRFATALADTVARR